MKSKIKFYYGPMFSGKTNQLILDVFKNRKKLNDDEILVFKPNVDTRHKDKVFSRTGRMVEAISINKPKDIYKYINDKTKAIFIDEIQFFNDEIVNVLKDIKQKNINVIVSGLNTNYKKEWFKTSKLLFDNTDIKKELKSICNVCKKKAKWSARTVNGEFDDFNSKEIIVDDMKNSKIEYMPLCGKHHPCKK